MDTEMNNELYRTIFEAVVIADRVKEIRGKDYIIQMPDSSYRKFSEETVNKAIEVVLEQTVDYTFVYMEMIKKLRDSNYIIDPKVEKVLRIQNAIKDIKDAVNRKNKGKTFSEEEMQEQLYQEAMTRFIRHSVGELFMVSVIRKKFPQCEKNNSYIYDSCQKVFNVLDTASIYDEDIKTTVYGNLFSKSDSMINSIAKDFWRDSTLQDDDVKFYMENFMTEEEIKKLLSKYESDLMTRENMVKILTKLKNVPKECLIKLYIDGKINTAVFHDNVTIKDILNSDIEENKILELLSDKKGRPIFHHDETAEIWKAFEEGRISYSAVMQMKKWNYISTEQIIELYDNSQKHKIAVEIGNQQRVSDEKILEFFTPDVVTKNLRKQLNDKTKTFYNFTLKSIYQKSGKDIEGVVANNLIEKYREDRQQLVKESFALYDNGFFSAKTIKRLEISENNIISHCEKMGNRPEMVIDFYNAGAISQDSLVEIYGDLFEQKALELIQLGMDATAIEGFYSTEELINMVRESQLSFENLAKIKSDIKTGLDKSSKNGTGLVDLYLQGQLTYNELFGLADAGIITIDEANEINEKYDLAKKWEKLKKQGIFGSDIEGEEQSQKLNKTSKAGDVPTSGVAGIDEQYIWAMYEALGATEYLSIDSNKCPVFKDYVVVPIMEKKVAYLEGKDGRTYIVPIKILLEQINNPNGKLDLIGNAESRNGFNSNKQYIRSVNHTKNWGSNVVMKATEIPGVSFTRDEAKKFLASNNSIIQDILNSYNKRKNNAQVL